MDISDERWHEMVDRAFEGLPEPHRSAVKNVAILLSDEPNEAQKEAADLTVHQTLLGLYSGVPLPKRQGRIDLSPDVITLFKNPLLAQVGMKNHYTRTYVTLYGMKLHIILV